MSKATDFLLGVHHRLYGWPRGEHKSVAYYQGYDSVSDKDYAEFEQERRDAQEDFWCAR